MTAWNGIGANGSGPTRVKGGRLEFLAPHLLRSQLLRPGFVRLSLRLGIAQQMPYWAKLQFLNNGVDPRDLEDVLGRITSLASWVDEWERLGRAHEAAGHELLGLQRGAEAARRLLAGATAYHFAQYVMFLDTRRKAALHDSCVRAYRAAAPHFEPPARPFEVMYRRRTMKGFLRMPPGPRPAPVVVLFNGTNAVKEELHWWTEPLLERGLATIVFDGPGLGQTFHRMSMVAEPRPVGTAILNEIESHPELDPDRIAFLGMSLGGYLAIRMAAHDTRVRAVGAVSPPYSADIYWNVTLSALRRELAALYGIDEREMGREVHRITLSETLPKLRVPLLVAGGGQDHITPGTEAWRIFEDARTEREIVFYPKGAHDCFNVLADLRPRMVSWLATRLGVRNHRPDLSCDGVPDPAWRAAEAVDPDFADALRGEFPRRVWKAKEDPGEPVHWRWPWEAVRRHAIEVVHRRADAEGPLPATG